MSCSKHVIAKLAAVFISLALISVQTADAFECYDITGWTSTPYNEVALVQPTSCAVTPQGEAWLHVLLSPNNDMYLRISLSDSHMSNEPFKPLPFFKPLLVFSHYDTATSLPVVLVRILPCISCENKIESTINPPEQGDIFVLNPTKVRLHHLRTGRCLTTNGVNGDPILSKTCEGNSNELFELQSAGTENGQPTYRLKNVDSHQCIYARAWNGAPGHHWGCWADPNMRFYLVPFGGGYRLHHIQSSHCLYVSSVDKKVYGWGCWNDSNMVFKVDIVAVTSLQLKEADNSHRQLSG